MEKCRKTMPPIWSSSERPISVRTVWVDGIRHAILSHDDPFLNIKSRRRSQTSVTKEKIYPVKYEPYKSNLEGLDKCFLKLRVVVEKSQSEKIFQENLIRTQSAPCSQTSNNNFHLSKTDERKNSNFSYEDNFQSDTILNLRKTIDSVFENDKNSLRKSQLKIFNCDDSLNEEENDFTEGKTDRRLEENLNPLSEKVLRWLDFSGKVQDYVNEEKEESNEDESEVNFIRKKISRRRENLVSIPIQSYKLEEEEEEREEESLKKIMKKRLFRIKDTSQDSIFSNEYETQFGDIYREVKHSEEMEPPANVEKKIIWCPPGKIQLHIFLPSLKAEIYSSQESLICD